MAPLKTTISAKATQAKTKTIEMKQLTTARVKSLNSAREKLISDLHFKQSVKKWSHKPKLMEHLRKAEMVSLNKESSFAMIPAELQLDIISHMEYADVLSLQRSCRYFNFFINDDMVQTSKERQRELFEQSERKRQIPDGFLPCYTCMKLQPTTSFHNSVGSYFVYNPPYNYYTTPAQRQQVNAAYNTRFCVRCGFKERKFPLGTKVQVRDHAWVVCRICGIMSAERAVSATSTYAYGGVDHSCTPCANEYKFLNSAGVLMRLFQWAVAVVILPLACSGKAMPLSSRADADSARWICTIVLDLLTIGGTATSLMVRMQLSTWRQASTKRSESAHFVFPVELAACLCWIGLIASLLSEGRSRNFEGRFDRFAKGLTAMSFVEGLTFVITSLWANYTTRGWLVKGSKRQRVRI